MIFIVFEMLEHSLESSWPLVLDIEKYTNRKEGRRASLLKKKVIWSSNL